MKKFKKKIELIIQTYTYQEIFKKCIIYFNEDELAASTWINKYALKNNEGQFLELTPDDMHIRMAKEFARIEKKYSNTSNLNGNLKQLSKYGQERELLNEKKITEFF